MVSLEQKIKEYVSSVEIPDRVKPEEIRRLHCQQPVELMVLKMLPYSVSEATELMVRQMPLEDMLMLILRENSERKALIYLMFSDKMMHILR